MPEFAPSEWVGESADTRMQGGNDGRLLAIAASEGLELRGLARAVEGGVSLSCKRAGSKTVGSGIAGSWIVGLWIIGPDRAEEREGEARSLGIMRPSSMPRQSEYNVSRLRSKIKRESRG